MPTFKLTKKISVPKTFRASSVAYKFDIQENDITEEFIGNIDIEERKWNIGVIVGASGSGKTTIAKELFPSSYIRQYEYSSECIVDDMPKDKSVDEITAVFHSVGFGTAKSWLKPYSVLSTGEQMRTDLARAILEEKEEIVFDEFTSVINREVAKAGSYAIQKAVRKAKKRFIAVTCHRDIIEWLEPDWVFDTETMSFFLRQNTNGQILESKYSSVKEACGKYLGNITI